MEEEKKTHIYQEGESMAGLISHMDAGDVISYPMDKWNYIRNLVAKMNSVHHLTGRKYSTRVNREEGTISATRVL